MGRDDDKTQRVTDATRREAGFGPQGGGDKTERFERTERADSAGGDADRPAARDRLSWPARDQHKPREDARPTRPVETPRQQAAPAPDDDVTRLVSSSQGQPAAPVAEASNASPRSGPSDPVVGWLVVVDGPGKGSSLEVGAGANAIGRAPGQRLRVDFGDASISRERHATLVYEPRGRRFFLQPGDSRNLAYVGEEVVLAPRELASGDEVSIGETRLRFVALCGPDFHWP